MAFEQIISIWGMAILTVVALTFLALFVYWIIKE